MKSRKLNRVIKTILVSSALTPAITTVIACGTSDEVETDTDILTVDDPNSLFMDTVVDFLDSEFNDANKNVITISPQDFTEKQNTEDREQFIQEEIDSYISSIYNRLIEDKNAKRNGLNFRAVLRKTNYSPNTREKTNPLLDALKEGLNQETEPGKTYLTQITEQINSEIDNSAINGGTDADFREPFTETIDLKLTRPEYKDSEDNTKNVSLEPVNYQLNINFQFELTQNDLNKSIEDFNGPDGGFQKAKNSLPKDADKPYLEILHDFGSGQKGDNFKWSDIKNAGGTSDNDSINSAQEQIFSWFNQAMNSDPAFQNTIDVARTTNKFQLASNDNEDNQDIQFKIPEVTTTGDPKLSDVEQLKWNLKFTNKETGEIKTEVFTIDIAFVNTKGDSDYLKTLLKPAGTDLTTMKNVYDEISVDQSTDLLTVYTDKTKSLQEIGQDGQEQLSILSNYFMEKLASQDNFAIAKNVNFNKSHLTFVPESINPEKTEIEYKINWEAYGLNFLADNPVVSSLDSTITLQIADPNSVGEEEGRQLIFNGGIVNNSGEGIDSNVGNNVISFLERDADNYVYRENLSYESTLQTTISQDDINSGNELNKDYLRLLNYLNNFTRWSYNNLENADQLRAKGALTFNSLYSNKQNMTRPQNNSGSDYQKLVNEFEVTISQRNHMALELVHAQISQIIAARPELNDQSFVKLNLDIPYPSKYETDDNDNDPDGKINVAVNLKVSSDNQAGIQLTPSKNSVQYEYDQKAIINSYADATRNFNENYWSVEGANQFINPLKKILEDKGDDPETTQGLVFNFDIAKVQSLVTDMETYNTYYAPLIRYLSNFAQANPASTDSPTPSNDTAIDPGNYAPYSLATFLPTATSLGEELFGKLDKPTAEEYTKFANYLLNDNTGNKAYIEVNLQSENNKIATQRLYLNNDEITDASSLDGKTDEWAVRNLISSSQSSYLNTVSQMTSLFPNFEKAQIGDPNIAEDVTETTVGMYDFTTLLLTDLFNLFFNNPLA